MPLVLAESEHVGNMLETTKPDESQHRNIVSDIGDIGDIGTSQGHVS